MRLRPSRSTILVLAVLVLAVAGLAHGASLLILPWRSDHDAFARVAALTATTDRATLDPAGPDAPPFADPAMLTAVCRFDLRAKPFRLSLTPLADRFVTIGFHSRHGLAFYGLTVRAADATRFDLVLTDTPTARSEAEPDAGNVVVATPEPDGFVTLATPLGEGSNREAAEDRLNGVTCHGDTGP
ncbi:hypothetical protein P7D22_15195 [Lichenihabitans sp. Uapishka_5]|uniref:hypothetical protein n=1 Tax=Lichenihabitans sp. Uapishka_5 TaxID=3037302 RepID=UPI0029E7CE4D|nr:hypothetical protein [Lichenihabitans sp. Uapishka_5]MDX7952514.1 hypothetical protein [Lichenihabitans sp. Uapishka_5]